MTVETRTVGQRGQVTIPQQLRERFGLSGGDEVVIREEDGRIVIELPMSREEVAEGYRQRAERMREMAEEGARASSEADELLGDAPAWD